MPLINQASVLDNGNFTKKKGVRPGKPKAVFLIPRGNDLLTTAEIASGVQDALQSKLINSSRLTRIFMIGQVGMVTHNGRERQYEEREGFRIFADKATKDMRLQIIDGTWGDYKQLCTLDGVDHDIAILDDRNYLWHKASSTGIKGFTSHAFEVEEPTDAVDGTAWSCAIRVAFSSIDDVTKNADFIALDFDPLETLYGIEGVVLKDVTPSGHAAGVFDASCTSIIAGAQEFNFAELYGPELDVAGAWTATNASGATITISSVATVSSPAGDGTVEKVAFRFTFDTGDADYPSSGGKIYVRLAGISTIEALVDGLYVESNTVVFTV